MSFLAPTVFPCGSGCASPRYTPIGAPPGGGTPSHAGALGYELCSLSVRACVTRHGNPSIRNVYRMSCVPFCRVCVCALARVGCAYALLGCAYECAHMSVIQCQQQALVSRVHSTTRARITSCVEFRVLGLGFRVYILRIVFSIPPLTNLKPRPSKTPNPRP